MSWNDLQRLVESGVEIGAHGARHRPLDIISSDERRADLSQAYHALSTRFGHSSIGFAYPYGRWSLQTAADAAIAGFQWGCTARGGINHPQTPRFKLRRTLIRSQTSLFQFACQVWTGYADWRDWRMDVRRIP
jgi:peptidoglycan/xylan/chitin deacetylase (PgdA/CDA1 family)